MKLSQLDAQLHAARHATETPEFSDHAWRSLASTIQNEVTSLDEATLNRIRRAVIVPPERYHEQLSAFQAWMDLRSPQRPQPDRRARTGQDPALHRLCLATRLAHETRSTRAR